MFVRGLLAYGLFFRRPDFSSILSPPMVVPASSGLLLSTVKDTPAAEDVTPQFSVDVITAIAPDAFAPSTLISGNAIDYAVVKAAMRDPGNQANALLPASLQFEQGKAVHYRFVSLTNGSFVAGVSTQSNFKDNFSMRSLGLNGSNGGLVGRGLLKGGYGPSFNTPNTIIDWIMELDDNDHLSVYIAVNNKPLGAAFRIPFTDHTALLADLCPLVSFIDTMEAVTVLMIRYESGSISDTYKQRNLDLDMKAPYINQWIPIADDWSPLEFPPMRSEVMMSANAVAFRVMNTMRVGISVDGHNITPKGPVISTRMMAPPPFRETETAVADFLTSLDSWRVQDNVLILTSVSAGDKRFKLRDPSKDYVTENPLVVTPTGGFNAIPLKA